MMAEANERLRENDVGPFGELSKRPNPDNLVILTVPAFEYLLPSLQKQLGRDLTPEEIEVQRRKAPAMAVRRSVAEKMQAARAATPAPRPADTGLRPPSVASAYNDMPTEPAARMEAAVDVFGQHLFSLRNQL